MAAKTKQSGDGAITRDRIVSEALQLMNDEGFDQVTLRRIASRLGMKAPSLYWYVESKAALHGLMGETVLRAVFASVPDSDTWQDWLLHFGKSLWREQMNLRDSARMISTAVWPIEMLEWFNTEIDRNLSNFGLDAATILELHSSVQALVTGWSAFAQGSSAPTMKSSMDVEACVIKSLEILVHGWSERLAKP